ncbi:MAG: cytochrome b/b6 domain-containing protein [Bacteriovoracia bacterium]
MVQRKIHEKHSVLLRIFHWVNVPILLLMIWSGILIYWAYQPYVKIPDNIGPFQIHHRLAEGMGWHFFLMWPLLINGLFYLIYLLFSKHWKQLIPSLDDFPKAIQYTLFDLKLRSKEPQWEGLYNPAQKIAYSSVILFAMGSLLTGLAIFKPVQLGFITELFGGYASARFLHFVFMSGLLFFTVIHIIQVIRAGWNNFRAMVAGFEVEEEKNDT